MPDRESPSPGATLGGGALIALWYLLLLYRFPYSLPYRGEDFFIAGVGLLLIVLFAAIVCALAIFAIRLLKSRGQAASLDGPDEAGAVTAHYLSHLKKLILFSLLVVWMHLLRGMQDDAAVFALMATPLVFVLSSALANLVTAHTGGLDARRWSPEGWLAALVVLTTAVSLVTNAWDLSQRTWELVKLLFLAATGSAETVPPVSDMEGEIALWLTLLWLMVFYYVILLYQKWRGLIEDGKVVCRKLAELCGKIARRLRGAPSSPPESPSS